MQLQENKIIPELTEVQKGLESNIHCCFINVTCMHLFSAMNATLNYLEIQYVLSQK